MKINVIILPLRALLVLLLLFSPSNSFCDRVKPSNEPQPQSNRYLSEIPPSDLAIVNDFAERNHGRPFIDRVESAAQALLNRRFSWYPLGEGKEGEFDQRPLVRFDEFDCSTWVETVMALSHAKKFPQFLDSLISIRYKGKLISFQTRNHFPHHDWIVSNISNGLLVDATATIAGIIPPISYVSTNLPGLWYSKLSFGRIFLPNTPTEEQKQVLEKLRRLGKDASPMKDTISYIPMNRIIAKKGQLKTTDSPDRYRPIKVAPYLAEKAKDVLINEDLLNRIPMPALIQVIKPGWDRRADLGYVIDVGHRGILTKKNGVIYFQQMSLRLRKSVALPLEEDLLYRMEDEHVKGYNFYELLDRR